MIDPTSLVPLPVVLPLVGAGLAVVTGRWIKLQRLITALVTLASVLIAGFLMKVAASGQRLVLGVAGWLPTDGITLVVDRLSALMLLISSIVILTVMIYAIGEGRASDEHGDGGAPLPIFHPTLLVLAAGVSTTFLSGDLFHIYVGFEMLLFASFVLLTIGATQDRVRAGVNYVVVNLLSSSLFLLAIGLIYSATGTVNLAQLGQRLPELPAETQALLHGMLLVGFGIKAAIFPMSGWLPDSYPTAPAPVTAVFAGLLTKVGIYTIIRTQTLLFPSGPFNDLLLWAALLTMLVGILGAIAQDDIKRLLSFTLVSHIGYLVFGIAIGNDLGLSSGIFYAAHHITVQTALFLVVGLIEMRGGSTSMQHLGGLLELSPGLALLFFIPAINLAGVPPFSGFLGKVGLIRAGVLADNQLGFLLITGSLVTSLLTLYAVSRVWSRVFLRSPRALVRIDREVIELTDEQAVKEINNRRPALGVSLPTAALVAFSTAFTVVAGPLMHYTDEAALQLNDRAGYISSVVEEVR